MKKLLSTCAVGAVFGALLATSASAAPITLELIDSYNRSSAFGLAFDGTNIWWSDSSRVIHEMTTSGVDTGRSFSGPVWSELAWNGTQLIQARGNTVYYFDAGTGANMTTDTITAPGARAGGLTDGLDWDNGELWVSPDVSDVFRLNGDLDAQVGAGPFLGGAGGYSGVERIQGGSQDYLIVVNDASNPRQLCVHNLDASLIGCESFQNSRYEGLAFDGRYLWAADFYGNRIDKYDILGDGGGSIIVPSPVPLPAGFPLLLSALGGFALFKRKTRKQS